VTFGEAVCLTILPIAAPEVVVLPWPKETRDPKRGSKDAEIRVALYPTSRRSSATHRLEERS
jgi:predicted metalloenzyme YecM